MRPRLVYVIGFASLIALVLSGLSWWDGHGRAAPSPVGSGDGESSAELRRQVEALRAEVAALRSRPPQGAMTDRPASPPAALQAPTQETRVGPEAAAPTFVRFEPPSTDVEVHQSKSGAVTVNNRNPALTGKVLSVKAIRDDGSEETLQIVVPAPGT